MKKILIFSLAYFPKVSGAELAVKEITDRIAPEEIQFHMVTMRFSTADFVEDQIGNIRVYRVGKDGSYLSKILFIPRAVRKALQVDEVERFDALWALMSYMAFPIALLRLCGMRKPYVLTLQDGDPFEHVFNRPHIRPFMPLLRAGFARATVVQVISTYLGGWMQKFGYHGPIEVVPNGVDVPLFAKVPNTADVEALQQKLGKRKGDVWLVHTGRLVKKNALDVVITALPQLPTNIHLLLIGSGVEDRALKDLADSLGVSARVHFVGTVDNQKLPLYLRACDIFIRPSRTEGMGTSFIEAFAAGIPVIATQAGGIADFLFDCERNPDHQPTGFAVDIDAPDQIARAVEKISQDPEAVEAVTKNAQALVRQTYDWNLVTEQMQKNVFGRVLT